jgi:hypothetical protein
VSKAIKLITKPLMVLPRTVWPWGRRAMFDVREVDEASLAGPIADTVRTFWAAAVASLNEKPVAQCDLRTSVFSYSSTYRAKSPGYA